MESLSGSDGTPLDLAPPPPPVSPGEPVPGPGENAPPPVLDADAPFGRKADGSPRQRPGPKPGRHDRPRVTTVADVHVQAADTDAVRERRVKSIRETLQVGAISCLTLAATTGNDAFKADAHVLAGADHFAEASAELAAVNPAFARFIDSGGKGAAYFAFGSAAASLGAQLAVNHGMLRPGFLGTRAPEDFLPKPAPAEPEGDGDGPSHTEG
jgi:hypothetical protein